MTRIHKETPPPAPAPTKGKVNWGLVGATDVAGAVIAGVSASTALVVPFVGWGFWGVVTVGGALVSSGAVAIIYVAS